MEYGALYAQRAWVTAERVVNTRDVDEFLEWAGRRKA
jgi:histidinol phosphatase-like PHP family hydrolase